MVSLKKHFVKGKRGEATLSTLGELAVGVAALCIILVVGFLVLSEAKEQIQDIDGVNATGGDGSGNQSSHAFNATSTLQTALDDVPGWVPLIVITVVGAALLGLVMAFRRRG
jgi:hypothetical protein